MTLELFKPLHRNDPLLDEVIGKLVAHWGNAGPGWGLGRAPAEVHALLFALGSPVSIEEIAQRLTLSESAAGHACATLREWGLIRLVKNPGDRRNYYEAELGVETVVKTILRERQRRELAPARDMLQSLVDTLESSPAPRLQQVNRADFQRRLTELAKAARMADQFTTALLKEKGLATWIARRFGRLLRGKLF
jgi:DNA-binding transcriptional regulator GbsR (MarR family)